MNSIPSAVRTRARHQVVIDTDRRRSRLPAVLAILAPVVLTAGWLLGAAAQPEHFSFLTSTISDLAAYSAHDRGIMTAALAVTGLLVLAVAFLSNTKGRTASRCLLAVAGLAIVLVAAAPLPVHGKLHGEAAFLAFVGLAIWPVLGFRIGSTAAVRAVMATLVTLVDLIFLLWLQLLPQVMIGFSERALATVTLTWIAIAAWHDSVPSGKDRVPSGKDDVPSDKVAP